MNIQEFPDFELFDHTGGRKHIRWECLLPTDQNFQDLF